MCLCSPMAHHVHVLLWASSRKVCRGSWFNQQFSNIWFSFWEIRVSVVIFAQWPALNTTIPMSLSHCICGEDSSLFMGTMNETFYSEPTCTNLCGDYESFMGKFSDSPSFFPQRPSASLLQWTRGVSELVPLRREKKRGDELRTRFSSLTAWRTDMTTGGYSVCSQLSH